MTKILITILCFFTFSTWAQFKNESELGVASANGNTKTQSISLKQANDYKWNLNIFSAKVRYLNAKANGVETARYIMGGGRYERQVSNHFGLFLGESLEKDKFAGIDNRYITDFGGNYRFIESEMTKFFTELGYRYMHEARIDKTNAFSNYGRSYTEWEHKWNQSFSTKIWAEYLPNITDLKDWQFNSELSLMAMLNSVLSLKTGILLRYDHLPAPGILYKTDTLFSTALVAKF
jgi:putative salt-induced outer membrane protein YdiY